MEKLLPKAGSWNCPTCALVVNPGADKCPACQTAKPGASTDKGGDKPKPALLSSALEKLLPKAGSWNCPTCALVVDPGADKCPACQTAKPGTKPASHPAPTFSFSSGTTSSASSTTTGFIFGGASNSQTSTSTPLSKFIFGNFSATTPKSTEQPSLTSSSPSAPENKILGSSGGAFSNLELAKGLDKLGSGFTFKLKPPTPIKSKTPDESVCEEDNNEGQEEDEAEVTPSDLSQITFKPVVDHLPDKIEVLTGEEGEEIVFEARAKLFRFDSCGVWKERGLGQLKLLRTPDSGRVRVVMRREQVHKVCCNHPITAGMSLKPMEGSKAPVVPWVWWGVDFSEDDVGPEGRKEMFSVRFKTAEESEAFHDAFMKAVADAETPVDLDADQDELVIVENPVSDNLVVQMKLFVSELLFFKYFSLALA